MTYRGQQSFSTHQKGDICNFIAVLKTIAIGILILLSFYQLGHTNTVITNKTSKSKSASAMIQGTWVLTKDDDKPDQPVENEKLYFYGDGSLLISGKGTPLCGVYTIKNSILTMILAHKGLEVDIEREFKIDNEGFHLANRKIGYAHYARSADVLPAYKIDEGWEVKSFGPVSLKLPNGWQFSEEPPNELGNQRLQVFNANGMKQVLIVRTTRLNHLSPTEISRTTEEIIKIIALTTTQTQPFTSGGKTFVGCDVPITKTTPEKLYGMEGPVIVTQVDCPIKVTIKSIGIKLDHSSIILMTVLGQEDRLQELKHVVQSITVDGAKLPTK